MATDLDAPLTTLEFEFERLNLPTSRSPSHPITSTTPTCEEPAHPPIITLDIAGRTFKVSADILIAGSGLFQRQLSSRFNWTPQRDGTYFMDADPELFEHLLRFMRRPSVFPLFWAQDRGFDYDLYQRLQAEAEYFQMASLYQWIKDKKYLKAIAVRIHKPHTLELDDIEEEKMTGSMSKERHYVTRSRKMYVCPRRIPVHYGEPGKCGKACRAYQGDDDTEYDDEDYIEVVSTQKEIVFDETVCQVE